MYIIIPNRPLQSLKKENRKERQREKEREKREERGELEESSGKRESGKTVITLCKRER